MKFKEGDRVIVSKLTEESVFSKRALLGTSFTIDRYTDSKRYPYHSSVHWMNFSDEELEHDLIYNSPLYKVLT
jgi:hypothetical protein